MTKRKPPWNFVWRVTSCFLVLSRWCRQIWNAADLPWPPWLVGGLEHFYTCFIFPYIGNNHPNWLIFFRGVGWNHQPAGYFPSGRLPTSASLVSHQRVRNDGRPWVITNAVLGSGEIYWGTYGKPRVCTRGNGKCRAHLRSLIFPKN